MTSEQEPSWLVRHWQLVLLPVACTVACLPFFETLRPPLQDLPQHLAAARVLLDGSHAGFRFEEFFSTDWLGTQYLGTYLLLGAFFHPLRLVTDEPLLWASRFVLVGLVFAWPLAVERLGRRLTGHVGMGAFALVLLFNVHLILGFLNFVLGIATCVLALGSLAAFRQRRASGERALGSILGWGFATFACFTFHIVPFTLLLFIASVTFLAEELVPGVLRRHPEGRVTATRKWFGQRAARPYLALLPSLLGLAAWLGSPAGVSTTEAARGGGERGRAVYASFDTNYQGLSSWLADAFRSPWDTRLFWTAIGVLGLGLGAELLARFVLRPSPRAERSSSDADPWLLWSLRAVVPLCFALYFSLPVSYDWIWPINARFPILGLVFLPLWLPVREPGSPGPTWQGVRGVCFVALVLLAGSEAWLAKRAFAGFSKEAAGLDEVLATIPPGQRVASLVFQRGSDFIGFSPFLHVGAYYQAERGGVSFFSFADFPQSPIRFLDGTRPPKVPPRWEWRPERVKLDEDLDWFDFVIVRGGTKSLERSESFERQLEAGRFRLFRRRHDVTAR